MGKPTGFMEYPRALPVVRPPRARVGDFDEFTAPGDGETLAQQGARCMDCGVPFCHTGSLIGGMAAGCPVNNLIPEWNDMVYRGFWKEALHRLQQTNNFPEFTGRVCPAPCEGSCVLGISEPPVTIKRIEHAIIERGFAEGWVTPRPPRRRSGKQIAIVGSGPAGLAAAAQLNHAGHLVTVFERADRSGGLLMYGIPNMKLDKRVVERRLKLLAEEGIRFVTRTEVGRDFPAERLQREFDAVVLCTGATVPRDLPIEGRSLAGIHWAVDFLTANTQKLLDGPDAASPFISARDRDVVVIGGGDTGTDCVATALRHGCRSLVQLEIMPKPPESRAPDNPWPQWPRIYRQDYGHEEATAVFGGDPRTFAVNATRFMDDGCGRVTEIRAARVEWRSENGRMAPREVPGTELRFPAQLVLLAMGFLGPEGALLDRLGVHKDPRGNARAEYDGFATSVPGIFAAGDARRGQSLVVWAINEGRGAARECDRYLMGETMLP